MTRLLTGERDVQVLVPLLHRLRIPFRQAETRSTLLTEAERAEALRIIRQGCDMATFGDALAYQQQAQQGFRCARIDKTSARFLVKPS